MMNISMIKLLQISTCFILCCREHFVDIKCFLNCNKIKKMGVTKVGEIVDAVKGSDIFELNSDNTMLRIKNMG